MDKSPSVSKKIISHRILAMDYSSRSVKSNIFSDDQTGISKGQLMTPTFKNLLKGLLPFGRTPG